ncbi:hypothetical protein [Nonomuraea sp. NPDC050310]|uniref:hypothetical protein n=1 Tax=Nonomuraea sp. NPDC050310 TaxID=3154935 RepID=UPI0033F12930
MIATLRYEFRMQIRRPALWIVYGIVFAIQGVLINWYFTLDRGLGPILDPRQAMADVTAWTATLPMIAYGCLIADRLVRDRTLRVDGILDATPADATARLLGKFAGVCLAGAVPLALMVVGRGLVWTVMEGDPGGLLWSIVIFVVALGPGLLFTGALALVGPLVMPVTVFRVAFAAYWFWGNLIPPDLMPNLAHTLLAADGEYALLGLFGSTTRVPVEGALLNFLRPDPTAGTGLLSIALILLLAGVALPLARLRREP